MKLSYGPALLFASLAIVGPVRAEPVPEPVARMLETAIASGDKATVEAVVKIAKASNPNSIAEINERVTALKEVKTRQALAQKQRQGFFDGWSGEGEAGLSSTAGNSHDQSVALGVKLTRDGLKWRHKLAAAADYQKSDGVKTAQSYSASYEGDYRINSRLFSFGLLQWEQDRFAGYTRRFTESVGLGYQIVKTPTVSWEMQAGPAFRQTRQMTGDSQNKIAARVSTLFSWTIADGFVLTEDAAALIGDGNKTYQSKTALTAKINGALSARASYAIKYESRPPLGLDNTDTISRLTLVYGF